MRDKGEDDKDETKEWIEEIKEGKKRKDTHIWRGRGKEKKGKKRKGRFDASKVDERMKEKDARKQVRDEGGRWQDRLRNEKEEDEENKGIKGMQGREGQEVRKQVRDQEEDDKDETTEWIEEFKESKRRKEGHTHAKGKERSKVDKEAQGD